MAVGICVPAAGCIVVGAAVAGGTGVVDELLALPLSLELFRATPATAPATTMAIVTTTAQIKCLRYCTVTLCPLMLLPSPRPSSFTTLLLLLLLEKDVGLVACGCCLGGDMGNAAGSSVCTPTVFLASIRGRSSCSGSTMAATAGINDGSQLLLLLLLPTAENTGTTQADGMSEPLSGGWTERT